MSMTGGNDAESFYDSPIRYEPGTPEHFKAAAHALPHPFYLMPPGY